MQWKAIKEQYYKQIKNDKNDQYTQSPIRDPNNWATTKT